MGDMIGPGHQWKSSNDQSMVIPQYTVVIPRRTEGLYMTKAEVMRWAHILIIDNTWTRNGNQIQVPIYTCVLLSQMLVGI